MPWIHAHAGVVIVTSAIVVLLGAGALMVANRAPLSDTGHTVSWTGGGTGAVGSTNASLAPQNDSWSPARAASFDGLPTPLYAENTTNGESFSPTITGGASPLPTVTSAQLLGEVYALIPTALTSVAVDTPVSRSKTQQQLYDYGNDAGRAIEAYESQYGSRQAQIMRDFYEDMTNADKKAAVSALGSALIQTGDDLDALQDQVPSAMAALHSKLARGYRTIGTNLAQIPEAKGDTALLAAIQRYDESVDAFSKTYISIATTFSAAGVSFSSADPGREFTFTQSPSL